MRRFNKGWEEQIYAWWKMLSRVPRFSNDLIMSAIKPQINFSTKSSFQSKTERVEGIGILV